MRIISCLIVSLCTLPTHQLESVFLIILSTVLASTLSWVPAGKQFPCSLQECLRMDIFPGLAGNRSFLVWCFCLTLLTEERRRTGIYQNLLKTFRQLFSQLAVSRGRLPNHEKATAVYLKFLWRVEEYHKSRKWNCSQTPSTMCCSLCSLTPGTQLPGPRSVKGCTAVPASHAGHHCGAVQLRGHSGLGRQVLQQPRLQKERMCDHFWSMTTTSCLKMIVGVMMPLLSYLRWRVARKLPIVSFW